jgi:hypothetical protein
MVIYEMSILKILKDNDIKELYKKIVKIISLGNEYSFYDKATLIDDFLHYSKICKETIDNRIFRYECKSKCKFIVIVNYNDKTIELTELICE